MSSSDLLDCKYYTCVNVLVVEGFGPEYGNKAKQICQKSHFGLLCDETTDRGTDKQLVVLARVYVDGMVNTQFIDMPTCNLSTAQHLFDALNKSLRFAFMYYF